MGKVTLEMTTEQASAIAHMLDFATRVHLGQFDKIEWAARFGELKHQTGTELNSDELDNLHYELKRISYLFGFGVSASHGIGAPHVSINAKRAWEAKKVIARALAIHREPNPEGCPGVDYEGLTYRLTQDPAPTAKVE